MINKIKYLVGSYASVAIHTVVGCVQLAVKEPTDITMLKTSVADFVEWLGPREEIRGELHILKKKGVNMFENDR